MITILKETVKNGGHQNAPMGGWIKKFRNDKLTLNQVETIEKVCNSTDADEKEKASSTADNADASEAYLAENENAKADEA